MDMYAISALSATCWEMSNALAETFVKRSSKTVGVLKTSLSGASRCGG